MILSPQKNSRCFFRPAIRIRHLRDVYCTLGTAGARKAQWFERGWWENRGEKGGTIWKNLEKTHQKVGSKPWKIMFNYVLIDLELGEIYMD